MAAGYRDAYQIFLMLSRGLTLRGQIFKMSVKDVARLYEYWTYLKLGQILSEKYIPIHQDVIQVKQDGLYVTLDESKTAKRTFKHPVTDEVIELYFQKRNGRLPTVTQKPDTMLAIEKKERTININTFLMRNIELILLKQLIIKVDIEPLVR